MEERKIQKYLQYKNIISFFLGIFECILVFGIMYKAYEMFTFFKINGQKTLAGKFKSGMRNGGTMSVEQAVHDGDTIHVSPSGNLGIRFLAIDTPEVSFQKPGTRIFVKIANEFWVGYLSRLQDNLNVSDGLKNYLRNRVGPNCAANHAHHAEVAHRALERLINEDYQQFYSAGDEMSFFLVFSYEALDIYGRLLSYVNPDLPDIPSTQRPKTYNYRMLEMGMAEPYFLFPNIDPFSQSGHILDSVNGLNNVGDILSKSRKLREAREAVQAARSANLGVFSSSNPLQLSPFELRFLARGGVGRRRVINLGDPEDNRLHKSNDYYRFKVEDRLWIPEEFCGLFLAQNWQLV